MAVKASEYTAFATEHVGWLTSLVEPDPRLVIPFAIGLMAFANVEVMQTWRRDVSGIAAPTAAAAAEPPRAGSNRTAAKIRPNFGRISPTAKQRSTSSSSIIQNETDAGNMSPRDARRREVDVRAGTMRERVVGNVMRILAVVTVGIAAEVPAVSRSCSRFWPHRGKADLRHKRPLLFTGLPRPGIRWSRTSCWDTSIGERHQNALRRSEAFTCRR